MKKCDEILELLSLYIDNELDDERVQMVQEHVEACSSCKSELEQLKGVVKLCNNVGEVELPEDFKDVLHQRLISEKQKIDDGKKILIMRSRIMKTITSVAAVLLVVFAVRGLLNTSINNKTMQSYPETSDMTILENNINKEKTTNGSGFTVKSDAADQMGVNIDGASSKEFAGIYSDAKLEKDNASNEKELKAEADSNHKSWETKSNITATEEGPKAKSSNATSGDGATSRVELPKSAQGDNEVQIEFSEEVTGGAKYSKEPYVGASTEKIICFNMNSENIETDKMKFDGIAGKYGTIIENNVIALTDTAMKYTSLTEEKVPDYTVSYSMDKSNYDKFASEIEKSFSGMYKVTSDEEQLKSRLKDLEDTIAKLKNSNNADPDQLKTIQEERENILKQLESINSSSKIKVTITISSA